MSQEEFNKFLGELTKSLKKAGLSEDAISTAIAEAIKTREDEIAKESTGKVENIVVNVPQMLYGPPPAQEVHTVEVQVDAPAQMLYGPPPVQEVHTVEVQVDAPAQMLYGPPPVEEVHISKDSGNHKK